MLYLSVLASDFLERKVEWMNERASMWVRRRDFNELLTKHSLRLSVCLNKTPLRKKIKAEKLWKCDAKALFNCHDNAFNSEIKCC